MAKRVSPEKRRSVPRKKLQEPGEWPGGWITGLRVHSAKVQFEQRDPLFDVLRRDTERGVEFDVINRRWSWQGFTPQLVYGVKRHDSNLELYSFDRRYVRLGVSKQF